MYRCSKCGGVEVETLTWVDLNTGEEQDGEVGEYYCRQCSAHTEITVSSDILDSLDDDIDEEDLNVIEHEED